MRLRPLVYFSFIMTFVILSGCASAVTPTPTLFSPPQPTPLQTANATSDVGVTTMQAAVIPTFTLDTGKSVINYGATGPLNISFPGTFSFTEGTIGLSPKEDGYQLNVNVTIDGTSVTAVNGLVRDALRSNLEVDKFPHGYFIATSSEIVKVDQESFKFTAKGTLELHGQQRSVEMPFTASIKNGVMTANGQMSLDLLDYKVNVPTAVMSSTVTFNANITATCSQSCDSFLSAGTMAVTAATMVSTP